MMGRIGGLTASVGYLPPEGGWPMLDASRGLAAFTGWQVHVISVNVAVTAPNCECGDCEAQEVVLVSGFLVMPSGEELRNGDPTTFPVKPQDMPTWLHELATDAKAVARRGIAAARGATEEGGHGE